MSEYGQPGQWGQWQDQPPDSRMQPGYPQYPGGPQWPPGGGWGGTPPPPVGAPSTNGLAIASFVLGLVSLIPFLGLLTAITSIILGFVARSQIAGSRGVQKGTGFATAGIVISFLLIAAWIVILVLIGHHRNHCVQFGDGLCRGN